jgi:hypothetical protein
MDYLMSGWRAVKIDNIECHDYVCQKQYPTLEAAQKASENLAGYEILHWEHVWEKGWSWKQVEFKALSDKNPVSR